MFVTELLLDDEEESYYGVELGFEVLAPDTFKKSIFFN